MIKFSAALQIPEQEYANQGNAILGIRDSGKSYTATWIAERLLEAGIPFVAFDPIGVWRNLKLPGKGKGFEVVVAGDGGDLALSPDTAPEIVRAAMRENIPLVIDLYSIGLSKADWRKIVEACVRILLYENKAHGLRHVFIEEAAEFCPQRVGPEAGRVYAEIEKLARMGGNSGLGYTLINQRAEEVNKAVLELCDCLFLHRQKGRHSLTALGKWLDAGDVKGRPEIIRSLPALGQGDCWVWPQGSNEPQRVQIETKRSHHPDRRNLAATATAAKAGADVSAFVRRLADTMEKSAAPKAAKLAKDMAEIVDDHLLEQQRQRIELLLRETEQLSAECAQLRAKLAQIGAIAGDVVPVAQITRDDGIVPAGSSQAAPLAPPACRLGEGVPPSLRKVLPAPTPGDPSLSKAVRAILAVLKAYHPRERSRESVALQSGYSAKGGSFQNSLSQGRTAGLIVNGPNGGLAITATGLRAAGDVAPVPTGKALVAYWTAHASLGRVERQILKAVTSAGRRLALSRQRVAVDAGYELSGGSFQNGLSRLRTLGLISGSREITAAPEFFS